jgi:predicted DNA-binding mobile mystery protein A
MCYFPGYNLDYRSEDRQMLNSNKRLARRRIDGRLRPLQSIAEISVPPRGWLRAIREALGMSGTQFARRLGLSWQSMDDIEKSEAAGTIGLATLRKAAAALDCTLVYALVPNRPLEEMVDKRAKAIAKKALGRVDQTMALEDQRVTHVSRDELIADYISNHVRDRDLWDEV